MRASVSPCFFHSTSPDTVWRVVRTQGSPPQTPGEVWIQLFVSVFSAGMMSLRAGLLPGGSPLSGGLTVVVSQQPADWWWTSRGPIPYRPGRPHRQQDHLPSTVGKGLVMIRDFTG